MKIDVKRDGEVEKGLGSIGKLKILRLLIKKPNQAFTRYELGKKISNDPISIRNDLKALVQINWITELKIQHLNKYAINFNNDIVKRLADFLREIKYIR